MAPNMPPPSDTLAPRSMACFFRPPCSSLCRPCSGGGTGRAGLPTRGFGGGSSGRAGLLFPGGSQSDHTSWSPARVPSEASGRDERARCFQGEEGTASILVKGEWRAVRRVCARKFEVAKLQVLTPTYAFCDFVL